MIQAFPVFVTFLEGLGGPGGWYGPAAHRQGDRIGIMPGGKGQFSLRMMGSMGMRMIHGVVVFLLIIAFLILAGL